MTLPQWTEAPLALIVRHGDNCARCRSIFNTVGYSIRECVSPPVALSGSFGPEEDASIQTLPLVSLKLIAMRIHFGSMRHMSIV
jgi:predicted anti-sigma-YlaC factor YlaD